MRGVGHWNTARGTEEEEREMKLNLQEFMVEGRHTFLIYQDVEIDRSLVLFLCNPHQLFIDLVPKGSVSVRDSVIYNLPTSPLFYYIRCRRVTRGQALWPVTPLHYIRIRCLREPRHSPLSRGRWPEGTRLQLLLSSRMHGSKESVAASPPQKARRHLAKGLRTDTPSSSKSSHNNGGCWRCSRSKLHSWRRSRAWRGWRRRWRRWSKLHSSHNHQREEARAQRAATLSPQSRGNVKGTEDVCGLITITLSGFHSEP